METILWIIGGLIVLAIAIFLFMLALRLCTASLILGAISWLIFDSFWLGAIVGAIITIILIIMDPSEFFDELDGGLFSSSSSSSKSNSSTQSERYIRTSDGCHSKISYDTAGGFVDEHGRKWKKQSDGSYSQE